MHAQLRGLLLAAALASPSVAFAQTVYDQPGTQACNPSCWTSHYAGASGFRAYDNFTLGSTAQIGRVTWQGIYIDQSQTITPGVPNTINWTIGFFADSSNFPGTELYTITLPAASVTATKIGSGSFGASPVDLYSFSATLPSTFTAVAGTTYWFSPLSLAASFTPFFSWSPATATVDGLTAQTDTNGNHFNRPNDRAFSLVAGIPEPATWAMMVGGFALAGGAMRRRRLVVAYD
ncbi:PEPxxWA-CTERM sorting domain-containing protein [Sphingomonas tabacisoli]|uniref:PEPxxWA-CTERM sorting domain-containing protein n=1 Tax=Sphingomonas tabacisoli TaxID=2249466 RepID=A0ABW4I607_9SPHN